MKPKILFTKLLKKLLISMEYGSGSTSTNMVNTNMPEQIPLNDTLSNGTFLHSITTLKYDAFIEIMDKGDISLMTLSGNPSQEELEGAWLQLLQEYSDLVRTDKTNNIFEVWLKIEGLRWKIDFVDKALEVLKLQHDETTASALVELGYDYVQPLEDREAYLKQVYFVQTEAKSMVVFLNQYKAEYKLLVPEGQEVEERDRMYYEKELAHLSRFMGYRIIKSDITVYEFCSIVNTYLDSVKQNQK
jgi:hypothetical protein